MNVKYTVEMFINTKQSKIELFTEIACFLFTRQKNAIVDRSNTATSNHLIVNE